MSSEREILQKLLRSETSGDLLALFHRNPGLIDTTDGVARRIGRLGTSIEGDATNLVEIGVLGKKKVGKLDVLYLNRRNDRELGESITRHLMKMKKID